MASNAKTAPLTYELEEHVEHREEDREGDEETLNNEPPSYFSTRNRYFPSVHRWTGPEDPRCFTRVCTFIAIAWAIVLLICTIVVVVHLVENKKKEE